MYLSNSDEVNNVDVDDTSQTRQGNTMAVASNPSQSCPTLLVIDDNSTSNETTINKTDIPSNSSTQMNHVQLTSSSTLATLEPSKGIPEKQRRRTSSVAKLLGGQPLNNQQYEEINQQILDDQSSQNITNNTGDNYADTGIQRSRSSITRTLLMNNERNDNLSTTATKTRPLSPGFSKDFEYLIRRELDIEHAPSTFNRNSATPSIFQNLSSARNTPNNTSPSLQPSKFKRKRFNSKQTISATIENQSSNSAPFTITDPFELECSGSSLNQSLNSTPTHRSHHHQNDLYRFDATHLQNRHQHLHPNQQQYALPMKSSTPTSPALNYHKLNLNSSAYAPFKTHHDRLSITNCSSSSSSCNCCHYPVTAELSLPTPVSPVSPNAPSPSFIPHHTVSTSSHKNKTTHTRPDIYETPMQRSYCTITNQSNTSLSTSSSLSSSSTSLPSGHSVPLKKRLLHAYKNEQCPSSTL